MASLRASCDCKNDYQDSIYGKFTRSATPVNKTKVNGKLTEVRCTSCGRVCRNFREVVGKENLHA